MVGLLGVSSMSGSLNHRIEPTLLISSVVHSQNGTIGFMERVRPFNYMSVTSFFVLLDITGVFILYAIFELVLSWSLHKIVNNNNQTSSIQLTWCSSW